MLRAAAESDLEQTEKEVHALFSADAPGFAASVGSERLDKEIRNADIAFERVVRPRLDNATLGCHEARVALAAWFTYWRPLQEAGIADNPDVFPIYDGKARTGSFDIPKRIMDALAGECASEAHDRCVATGDLPYIFGQLVALQRFWEVFLGQEMPQGWIDAFVRAAKLCGQWTLNIKTEFSQTAIDPSCCGVQGKMHRDITLRWEPNGTGIGNIFNSTIVGESDVVVDAFDFNGSICERQHGPPVQKEQAKAKLAGLVFQQTDYGTITPRHVWLDIQFGYVETEYSARCPYHQDIGPGQWPADEFELDPQLLSNRDAATVVEPDIHGLLILDNREGSSSPDVPSLWQFSPKPFRADLDIQHTMLFARVNYDARLTLRLTHTPH